MRLGKKKRVTCSRRAWLTGALGSVFIVYLAVSATPAQAVTDWSACRTEGGTAGITAGNSSVDIALEGSIVDTSRAFLMVDSSGTSAVQGADDGQVSGYILNNSTLRFERVGTAGQARVSYYVVECFNDEFSVQRGEIVIGSGANSNTAAISSVSTGQAIVLVSSRNTDETASRNTGLVTGELTDPTTVTVKRAVSPAKTTTVRYEVVEFDSSVAVQTGEISFTTGTEKTANISSVAPANSWLLCSYDAAQDGLQQTAIGCELTNSTTVTVNRHGNNAYGNTVRFYVVEFPSAVTVERGSTLAQHPGSNDDTLYEQDITVAAVPNLSKAFSFTTNTTSGTNTTFPRQQWLEELTTTTNLRLSFWRGAGADSFADNNKYWQVISFPIGSVPNAPSVTSVTAASRNPAISSSAYSGTGGHNQSDWRIKTSADCSSGTTAWESMNNNGAKTSIVVNTTNGSFLGPLAGQTALAKDTIYYACTRHTNATGDSAWSAAYQFTTNTLPTAGSASIDSGANTVILTPNSSTDVVVTSTVTDTDSCEDIASVTAVFYRSGVGAGAGDNNMNHYTTNCVVDSGSCSGPSDTTANYTCTFPVQYYADPTDSSASYAAEDWQAVVTPNDEAGAGAAAQDSVEMGSLISLNLSGTPNFGTLQLGTDSGAVNQTIAVENTGNVAIDFDISAYGATPGDGYALQCSIGTVPASSEKYSLTPFTYSVAGTNLSSTPTRAQANLGPSTGSGSSQLTYFGIALPIEGVGGSCSGNIAISAVLDS